MKIKLPLILLFFFIVNVFIGCKKNALLVEVQPLAETDTQRIIVLGSSTAAGWGASVPDSSWVNKLATKLIIDNKKKVKLINLAAGAYTTYKILPTNSIVVSQRPLIDTTKNITKALKFNPALVLINMPTNDIANNYSDDEILSNYKKITGLLDIANVPYIITGTQPRNFPGEQQRQRLKILNEKLVSLYNSFVNNYLEQLSTPTGEIKDIYSCGDGVHLNDKGHNIVYQSFINHPILKKAIKY